MNQSITVTVNGVHYDLAHRMTVSQLLMHLALANKRLAVEKDGEIIPRSHYQQAWVEDGSVFEIIVAVGGG